MRNSFISRLEILAEKDKRIVFLTGDLGFSVVESFQEKFPDRFFNVGIAEQNMAGIATGLAEAGMIPFIYSIAPFSLVRPFEFIKNGAVLHDLPIRVVAIGAGFEYGNLGFSHFLLEDIALTRIYSNLHCYAPGNNLVANSVLDSTYEVDNPVYYRISKNMLNLSNEMITDYKGDSIVSFQGGVLNNVCIFAYGEMAEEALKAKCEDDVFDLYSVVNYNPVPTNEIVEIISQYRAVVTLESHYINNGIGSLIAEIIAEHSLECKLKRMGIRRTNFKLLGNTDFMYQSNYIDKSSILKLVRQC